MVRSSSSPKRVSELHGLGAEVVEADYRDFKDLASALQGCWAIYDFVGASTQTPHSNFYDTNTATALSLVKASRRVGAQLFVYNSGLGVNTHTTQSYFLSKLLAERAVRQSGLRYVIFRPSYIIGPDDEFSSYLLDNILGGRPIPIYGSGNYRVQPILVDDAVRVYVAALKTPSAWSKTFDLVGPHKTRFVDYVGILAEALGRKASFVYVDLERALQEAMKQRSRRTHNPYLGVDELEVLISDFVSSPSRVERTFSVTLTPLGDALKKIARSLLGARPS